MNHRTIPVAGNGALTTAQQERGHVTLFDLPLLRRIQCSGNRVCFVDGQEKVQGGLKLPSDEHLEAVLEDGDFLFIASSRWGGVGGDYAARDYLFRQIKRQDRVVAARAKSLATFWYYSDHTGDISLDTFFDGSYHKPTAVLTSPYSPTGYRNSLLKYYTAVSVVDLQSRKEQELLKQGRNAAPLIVDGKTLIGITIPTSSVIALLGARDARSFEDIVQEDDLSAVEKINEKADLAHSCFGTHSCIPESDFEIIMPEYYPAYRVGMDTQGNIRHLERAAPTKSVDTLESRRRV